MARLPDLPGVLSEQQSHDTAAVLAEMQRANGMIPWFEGGHTDPWNHTEAAMALMAAGRRAEAELAFDWLLSTQHDDGSWCSYYTDTGIEDPRRDANISTYAAVGVWHHWLSVRDAGFVAECWPMVERALEFALSLQQPGGEVLWSYEPDDGRPGEFALVTGSSSVLLALRCGVALAAAFGEERPEWEFAALRLAAALAEREHTAFEDKSRWAMDWYYPVLGGALGAERMDERWDLFVLEGQGVRCLHDSNWVTAAETAECVLALDSVGRVDDARRLMTWIQYLRDPDGAYWTGCVHPQDVRYPADERSTYSGAAMVLAWDALSRTTPASGLFRGEGLPSVAPTDTLAPEHD